MCGKFDDIDFYARDHVRCSGWPLTHSEVAPFYDKAASLLNCCPDEPIPSGGSYCGLEWIATDSTLLFSSQPRLAISYWEHFKRSRAIALCLNSPVVGLNLGSNGERVESIVVALVEAR